MNLHEYQAKQLLRDQGIATPRGVVLDNAAQAEMAAGHLGGEAWVVKAQIHAGGRGKAGGVRVVRSVDDLIHSRQQLCSAARLVTYQNAPDGQMVSRLLIEETLAIAREIYLSLTVDRESERIVLVASGSGGMEIEEIARTEPEKILREVCDPIWGLQDFQCRDIAFGLGLEGAADRRLRKTGQGLYQLFMRAATCPWWRSIRWW